MAEVETSRLEKIAGMATGIAVGTGITAVCLYNPELAPFIAVGGGGGGEQLKNPKMFLGRVIAYGSLASALVLGGNYIGKSKS